MEWTFDPLQAPTRTSTSPSSESSPRNTRATSTASRPARCTVARRPIGSSCSGGSASRTSSAESEVPRFRSSWFRGSRFRVPGPRFTARAAEVAEAPVVNSTVASGEWRAIDAVDLSREDRRVWVEIPIGFTEMQQKHARPRAGMAVEAARGLPDLLRPRLSRGRLRAQSRTRRGTIPARARLRTETQNPRTQNPEPRTSEPGTSEPRNFGTRNFGTRNFGTPDFGTRTLILAAKSAIGRPARAGGCGTPSDLRRCCS